MKKLTLIALIASTLNVSAVVTQVGNPMGAGIPDNACSDNISGAGGLTNSVTFVETGNISDVIVDVDVTHAFRSDVQLDLTYNGITTLLLGDAGGSDDDLHAIFDPGAAVLCSDNTQCGGDAGFCDTIVNKVSCIPTGDLTAYNMGNATTGTWDLNICDDAAGDLGTFDAWSITLNGDGQLPVELLHLEIE